MDNDPALRRLLTLRLGAASYHVDSVDGAQAALDACVRSRPNLVITDLRMEPMDGLGLLRELKTRWPELSVIILTARGTIAEAVQATQCGAFGFLVKPVRKSELLGQVQRAIAASIPKYVDDQWRATIVSRSQLMEERLGKANRAAHTDCPVMLTGESGTGRELFARAIHAAGARREKPFIAITCQARAEDALDAELFRACADVRLICTTEKGGLEKLYSPKAIELLMTADWPGNVRLLFDVGKQNVALSQGKVMTKEFVQQSLGSDSNRIPSYDDARDEFLHDYLVKNLQSTAGNVSKSARLAKRNRTDFYKLLSRYRVSAENFFREPQPALAEGTRMTPSLIELAPPPVK